MVGYSANAQQSASAAGDSKTYRGPDPKTYQIEKLKDLHLETALVRDGRANVTIIKPASGAYDEQAAAIVAAIGKLTGVEPPVATDDSSAAAVPISGNLIALGNRSTNKTIEELYNRHYTLLDLRYPGTGGYVVRTLHNPFGAGHNVVFVGGSDVAGVAAATEQLIKRLNEPTAKRGQLSIGWIADIKLPQKVEEIEKFKLFPTWGASDTYKDRGVGFGWSSLSVRMALYYMTGDKFHAREFLRLAFPDEKAQRELQRDDTYYWAQKSDPIATGEHYHNWKMILYWDLIEEDPFFTDEQRLRITQDFKRQIDFLIFTPKEYRFSCYNLDKAPVTTQERHRQNFAMAIYGLGRYFKKDYPHPVADQCVRSAELFFSPLENNAWFEDNKPYYWYSSQFAQCLNFMLLSGWHAPVESGSLATLMRSHEILLTGDAPDQSIRSAAIGFLHQAAYFLQDGRWIYYRDDRTDLDTTKFRVGQSFWPEEHLKPAPPEDLVGKWSIYHLPKPKWEERASGLKLEESFVFGSFRNRVDREGDFIRLDGYFDNMTEQHSFSIDKLRIDGFTALSGAMNQLEPRVNGMIGTVIADDAALIDSNVLGDVASVVAETPNAPYSSWRRTLAQRLGRYALIVDDLTFRIDSNNAEIRTSWQNSGGAYGAGTAMRGAKWDPQANALWMDLKKTKTDEKARFAILPSDIMEAPIHKASVARVSRAAITMNCIKKVAKDKRLILFSLLARGPESKSDLLACMRLSDNAAALRLPEPAIAVVGRYQGIDAELAILSMNHLYGRRLAEMAFSGLMLVHADKPVNLDWDFKTGELHVEVIENTNLGVDMIGGDGRTLDGVPLDAKDKWKGMETFALSKGRHVFRNARPWCMTPGDALDKYLSFYLEQGQANRVLERKQLQHKQSAPPLAEAFAAKVDGEITDLEIIPTGSEQIVAVATRNSIHLFDSSGAPVRAIDVGQEIRMIHWWKEHKLLLAGGWNEEQVCAFDLQGQRKWVFNSEEDPRSTTYFWQSQRTTKGMEGIRMLDSGALGDGKSHAFVGSACTLEVIDENGQLVKRLFLMKRFPLAMKIVPMRNGKRNLMVVSNGPALDFTNADEWDLTGNWGYFGMPKDQKSPRKWPSGVARYHIFFDDFDGDGTKEIMGEITGGSNRLGIWDINGNAKYNTNFGVGRSMIAAGGRGAFDLSYKTLRDVDVMDIEGDSKKEIIVAMSNKMIVALDDRLENRWATRIDSPPTVMKVFAKPDGKNPLVVAGCEDGSVTVLDSNGSLIRLGKINGTPVDIETLQTNAGLLALLATNKGQIKGFHVDK
jgi:hypothetical protein